MQFKFFCMTVLWCVIQTITLDKRLNKSLLCLCGIPVRTGSFAWPLDGSAMLTIVRTGLCVATRLIISTWWGCISCGKWLQAATWIFKKGKGNKLRINKFSTSGHRMQGQREIKQTSPWGSHTAGAEALTVILYKWSMNYWVHAWYIWY